MDITKYSQFQLYLLTLNLLILKDQLIPNACDEWCINSTTGFSSYLFCALWLEDIKKFKPISIMQLKDDDAISEHVQVRNALYNFGYKKLSDDLYNLSKL